MSGVRRIVCAALAATCLLALPSAASAAAPLVVGIGEQSDSIFASAPWYKVVRTFVRRLRAATRKRAAARARR
jgi:hypothetical protein